MVLLVLERQGGLATLLRIADWLLVREAAAAAALLAGSGLAGAPPFVHPDCSSCSGSSVQNHNNIILIWLLEKHDINNRSFLYYNLIEYIFVETYLGTILVKHSKAGAQKCHSEYLTEI